MTTLKSKTTNAAIAVAVLAALAFAAIQFFKPSAPVIIGTNSWPGYEPLYLAESKQFFGNRSVKIQRFDSATEVQKAFREGKINAAGLTIDETITLLHSGVKLKIVAVTDFSNGADALVSRKEFNTVSDLRGKRIAAENTALGAYFLDRILQMNQLKDTEITQVPLEVNKHEEAVIKGDVDAAVTFDPVRTKLIGAGYQSLFDSSRIPGEIVDIIVVASEIADEGGEVVRILQDGWFKTLDYIEEHRDESLTFLSSGLKISTEELDESMKGLHYPSRDETRALLFGNNPVLLESLNRMQDTMVSRKLADKNEDLRSLFLDLNQ